MDAQVINEIEVLLSTARTKVLSSGLPKSTKRLIRLQLDALGGYLSDELERSLNDPYKAQPFNKGY